MTPLKRLKNINNKYKYTVFGYIHQNEQELSLQIIPALIFYLSLLYYFHGECFDRCSENMEISHDKMTITRNSKLSTDNPWNNFAIGAISIDSMKKCLAKWRFKLKHIERHRPSYYAHFVFHLLSNKDTFKMETLDSKPDPPYYQYNANGKSFSHKEWQWSTKYWTLEQNDEIILTLNTATRTFQYQKNNGQVVEINNIEQKIGLKYTLAVTMFDVKYSITLLDFDCIIR